MQELSEKINKVFDQYKKEFPDLDYNQDYVPLKLTEEWGECLQAYLMKSGKGRDKGVSPEDMQKNLQDEFADVLGFLLIFAKQEGIDPETALKEKWFKYLDK